MKKPIQFGKYYLLDRVNVGGMAEVFKAKAFGVEGFERLLAVKRILPNIAEDEEFITMFIDEAKIAVQLNHANVCQIFDLGKVEDSYFIALEFVHGKDLRAIFDRCKQKPVDGQVAMPIAQACFIVMKACEGLDYAHNKKDQQGRDLHLVHRDVSPQNVLISYEGEVKLIDFGIAKAAGKASKTQQGILKGKFGYMSPEQVRGLPLDRRSDIFSLGIVLYEMLTGERLFVGESDFSTLEKVRNVEILPPSTYNRRISDELERIVMKALAKDVDDRYQNAIDLHDDLQAFMYTAGEFYSRKDLAAWMKKVWAPEIEAETAKLESYQKMPVPELSRPTAASGGVQAGAPAAVSRRNSIPPPPPPGVGPGAAPRRPSGEHAAIAPPPPPGRATIQGMPAVAAPPAAPQNGGGAQAHADLGWDDEELATNIYDAPPDAADAVVGDEPDEPELSLDDIELNESGEAVPHPSVAAQATAPSPAPSPASEPKNGSAAKAKPFEFAIPEPSGPLEVPHLTQQRRRPPSRTPMFIGIGVVAVLAGVLGWGAWVFLAGGKPGEVVLTSEPAVGVQVLIDQARVNVDGTPATLKLPAGPHVLTVQREGYVPWNQPIDVKAGETIRQRAVLEPLAVTGFNLLSEPPGATALLDGKQLEGVTPLQIKGVTPGRHLVEVRSPTGNWSQQIELEAGKITDVRAMLLPPPTEPVKPVKVATEERPKPVEEQPKPVKVATEERPKREPALPRLPKEPKIKKTASNETDDEDTTEAPAKPVREKPAAQPSGEGWLRLGSKPWTNIAVDGKDTGQHTPQTHMKLSSGAHRITLTNPQFNIKETFSVDIKTGETETVIKDLRPQGGDD